MIVAVAPDKEPKALYRQVSQILQDSGYTIASSDPQLRRVTTTEREVTDLSFGGADYKMRLEASIRSDPTRAHLTGTYETDTFGQRQISNSGNQGTVPRETWMQMYGVAKSVSDSLRYEGVVETR
jgi:hypothetical protein